MIAKRGIDVGRFTIEFQVANRGDVIKAKDGLLAKDKVRHMAIRGVVDSGAARLVLPKSVVQELGLPLGKKTKVRYADGRTRTRDTAEDVQVEIGDRRGTFTAIVRLVFWGSSPDWWPRSAMPPQRHALIPSGTGERIGSTSVEEPGPPTPWESNVSRPSSKSSSSRSIW